MWFKVDDGFCDHAKVIKLTSVKGWEKSLALWTLAGSWSSKQETDGNIPDYVVKRLGFSSADAVRLVYVGLWEERGDSYVFHDWADTNPTRSALERKREKVRERVNGWRGKETVTPLQPALRSDDVTPDVTPPPSRPVPTRPDPSQFPPTPEPPLDRCIREINQARGLAKLNPVSRMQGRETETLLFAALEICPDVQAAYAAYLLHGDAWDKGKGWPIAKWAKTPMQWLDHSRPAIKRAHVSSFCE